MRLKKDNHQPTKIGIIGKIKIGEKHQTKGYPMSLDYFKANASIKAIEGYFNSYYHKASIIPVCFASNDDDFNTDHRLEIRDKAGKLYAYGDNTTFFVSMQEGFRAYEQEEILEKFGSVQKFKDKAVAYLTTDKHKAHWKEVLTLRFIVPKIPVLGVWELRTCASKSSIDQILANYDLVKGINGGSIERIPFILSVKKVKSQRVLQTARQYPVLSLDPVLPDVVKDGLTDMQAIDSIEIKTLGQ